jgi:maltose O-acetyltransferase
MKKALLFLPYLIYEALHRWHEEYRYLQYRSRYQIAPSFRFNGWEILFYGEGQIVLGEESYIGRGSSIQSGAGSAVTVGRACAISHNVRIYTTSNLADQDFSGERRKEVAPVSIGDNVWIGANVFINPGVSIGSNSVVGANSVVTRDVEPNSIVGGVPARLIRYKGE